MTEKHKDSQFLYDICFGLRPFKFEQAKENQSNNVLILDEETEVSDIYFIIEGKVGVGYNIIT